MAKLQDLHGGRGVVDVIDLLGAGALAPFSAVLWCTLEPGATIGRHRQQRDPELVICLGGVGEVTVDGDTQPFAAGSVARLPLGSTLALANPGDGPLTYLIVKAQVSAEAPVSSPAARS